MWCFPFYLTGFNYNESSSDTKNTINSYIFVIYNFFSYKEIYTIKHTSVGESSRFNGRLIGMELEYCLYTMSRNVKYWVGLYGIHNILL